MSNNAALMADISGNNPASDLTAYAAAGHVRIGLKATEGESYDWSRHNALSDQAHELRLDVVHYCFLHAESGTAQAGYFLSQIKGHIEVGDSFAADAEAAGVNHTIVAPFVDECERQYPRYGGWEYGSPYFLQDNGIRPAHGWGLWLADYTTASVPAFIPAGWKTYGMWQRSQTAHVAGIPGLCDLSIIAKPPKPKPTPTDLTVFERRHTNKFTRSMHHRSRPMSAPAKTRVTTAIAAASKAKEIT
jgi:GH25 family lysozyme M1 (1,4-beta-N-acetylmuramidase)